MTIYRSRGERGRLHRDEQFQRSLWCSARRSRFLWRLLQNISLRTAPRQRLIASLWRARLSIAFMRE
jgi:hypothetical protein